MSGIAAVQKLSALGYRFQVEGDALLFEWKGTGKPNLAQVRPLLALVKEHKPQVLAYLWVPISTERTLTCYGCGNFCPAINSPNPTQAWGKCKKLKKGRYGISRACEAILSTPDNVGEGLYG